ncbi:MAG: ExbD/TolR family protein [Verrucomicrobiia bacterium]
MKFRRQHQLRCELPGAVPIAAMMFLLLFYLIQNKALLLTPGVPVELPKVAGALPEGYSGALVVALDRKGNLFFRNVEVSLEVLPGELKRAAAGRTNLLLVLQADRRASHESITRVAAIARASGIHKTWLATQPGLLEKSTGATKARSQ